MEQFYKICFMGYSCGDTSGCFNGNISFIIANELVSISENKNLEKRVAVTPEIAKYINQVLIYLYQMNMVLI